MSWIALKMLFGDRVKYLGIVFGVSFAALLMTQQASIFWGLMWNTTSQIRDLAGADIWVMDPNIQFVDDIKPLQDTDLYRVRGVEGVAWAVRLFKNIARARFDDGNFQQMILLGVDEDSLVGAPTLDRMILGRIEDMYQPDAVIIDEFGFRYLWPGRPIAEAIGKTFEMNDKRAVIVGVCKASPTFQTFPILYTLYNQAVGYVPNERKVMSFVLAQQQPELSAEEVCERIREQTGLQALTQEGFMWKTIDYYMKRTGIPINFGITVLLGFIVGAAIAGQTFYLFTVENLKQFGALKAMGVSNWRLVGMSLLQAVVVGLTGYGLGVCGAALFDVAMSANVKTVPPAFFMTWHILVGAGVAVMLIVLAASLLSLRKVLVLEPAIVFKG